MDKDLFGERIRIAREAKGLSQEEFAARISRDQRAVSLYERGKRRIAATDLPLLAQVLDVPLMYFYEGETILDDVDAAMQHELRHLPNLDAKRTALELVRVFRDGLERQG
ncbi:MAG: helix-turn-helix domain-containing protein [Anaerolineae bacterium]|nr:helix-turn-helix domain-containing protein [Anaerolineae bacterium]